MSQQNEKSGSRIPPPKTAENTVRKSLERKRFHSPDLFGAANELVIEHAGEEYRLRITSKGKLILTK